METALKSPPARKKRDVLYHDQTHLLFDHILGNFESNIAGLKDIREKELLTEEEYNQWLEKAAVHLIKRVREFKIINGLLSIFFVVLFTGLQVTGNTLDMRKTARRSGRRNDYEYVVTE